MVDLLHDMGTIPVREFRHPTAVAESPRRHRDELRVDNVARQCEP